MRKDSNPYMNCVQDINNDQNKIIEFAENEYENHLSKEEKINPIRKENDFDLSEISKRNSNHSSNSFKKNNSSGTKSIVSENNSNIYIDKNNPNLRLLNKSNENNNLNHPNNYINSYSNCHSENYNSNFSFNKVVTHSSLNSENSHYKKNKYHDYDLSSCENLENEDIININNCPVQDNNNPKNNVNSILANYFLKKNYAFILFELNNFCFTQKDYFKNIYPELNLVMMIEFNDCYLSQEKLFFYRTTDDNSNIYFPFLNKEDIKYNKFRIIKPIEMNDEDFPIKISINFYTYTNYKLLPIGNEDIFLTLKKEKEMQKFNFYHNVHLKYANKKVGNTFFNLAYKIDEIYPNHILGEINKNLEILSV